jgi:hypothetical protein
MLPTMRPMEHSRTKRARVMKQFEEVRIGPIRLYFSYFELIGFQVDGFAPVVCGPTTVDAGSNLDPRRLQLEPDNAKWLPKHAFEAEWEKISGAVPVGR